jgi:hypothetical protein
MSKKNWPRCWRLWPVRKKRPGSTHERRCMSVFRCRRAAGL